MNKNPKEFLTEKSKNERKAVHQIDESMKEKFDEGSEVRKSKGRDTISFNFERNGASFLFLQSASLKNTSFSVASEKDF